MTPKFSILTACSNQLSWIGQCMRSVLAQTCSKSDWEMIIVDDMSNDRSFDRACEIAKKNENIRVFR